jgi:hypothetical protein
VIGTPASLINGSGTKTTKTSFSSHPFGGLQLDRTTASPGEAGKQNTPLTTGNS